MIDNWQERYEGHIRPYVKALLVDSTGINNPYHNPRHGLHVAWQCYDASIYYQLSARDTGNLIKGAIMHDFDHSGKIRGRDAEEIESAIRALKYVCPPEDRENIPEIEAIIRATQYPYVIPDEKLTLPMRIIRDADMSQNFSDVWIQQSWLGLAEEMGVDPVKFLKIQPEFLEKITFHTGWAKEKFEEKRAARISEIKTFIDIIDGKDPELLRVAMAA